MQTDYSSVTDALLDAEHIYIIGNGAAASIADHFACDLLKNCRLPAISLCSNSAMITAIANDSSFDYVFSTQLRMLFGSRDLLVVFSGSGNSENLVQAVKIISRNLVISGNHGGKLKGYASVFYGLETSDQMESENKMSEFCHDVVTRLRQQNKRINVISE
jgi:D-sedoheptulose 7-phosphate isomerase